MTAPGKEQSGKDTPNRNAQSTQGARDQAKDNQAKGKDAPTTNGQASGGRDDNRAQGDQDKKSPAQSQRDQDRGKQNQTQGQAPHDSQQGQNQREDQRAGGNSSNTSASVSFTTEQRTKIRETVFKQSNAPRVTNVSFSIKEGTVIPRTVRVVEVPDVIIEVHPEWHGYRYFIANEELVIVEPETLRIVAVINV
jgi:hypothetical protein